MEKKRCIEKLGYKIKTKKRFVSDGNTVAKLQPSVFHNTAYKVASSELRMPWYGPKVRGDAEKKI